MFSIKKIWGRGILAASLIYGVLLTDTALASERELRIYNWVEYIPKKILSDFQQHTGIQLKYDIFDSSEMLEAKLLTGSSGYDLVFPTHSQVSKLIKANAIIPLDRSQLSNWGHLDQNFMKTLEAGDPGNRYTVPYMWGTTLIGYNVTQVKKALGSDFKVDSWDMIFKEENISRLKNCGVAFLDAPNDILPIALHYLGLDPNSSNPADYAKAEALMMKIRPYIRYFNSSRFGSDLANGDICVAVAWSGGISMARAGAQKANKQVEIALAIPREGTVIWSDDMAIPKGAKNVAEAYEFINYLLKPEVIAEASNEIGYPNANADSTSLINPELLIDKNLFVPVNMRHNLFAVSSKKLKIDRIITRTWTSIRSGTQ